MKKRILALLCLLALLLSGCQVVELLRQVTEEGAESSSVGNAEKPVSSAADGRASVPQAASAPALSPPDSASDGAAGGIIQAAGPNDLMAVLQNPDAEAYRALGEAAVEVDDFESGDGSGHETILIVPLRENVRITVESVWYNYSLNFMHTIDVLGEFSGRMGEHLALHTFLSEGIPHTRVIAQEGDRYAVWDCQYDGMGGSDVVYVSPERLPEPISEFSSGVNMLSGAAATSAMIFSGQSPRLTPEELGGIPDAYWQTLVHALTMYTADSDAWFDPYSGEPMIIPEGLADAFRQALFPHLAMPANPPQARYVSEEKSWSMEPCVYGDFAWWEHIASESGADGKTGAVVIEVTCTDISPHPVAYRVEWAANDMIDIYNPFQYHITGVSRVKEKLSD